MDRRTLISAMATVCSVSFGGCAALRTIPDFQFINRTDSQLLVSVRVAQNATEVIFNEEFELSAGNSKSFNGIITQTTSHTLSVDVSNGVIEQFEWIPESPVDYYGIVIYIHDDHLGFSEKIS